MNRAEAGGMGCVVDPDWATAKSGWVTEVITLTNAHRATLGLSPLSPSKPLTDAATWKAAHMAAFGYMSHDDPAPPVDRSWDQRIEDCGYTHGMGENIAFGYRSPAAVVAGWIASTGHRRNIENPEYRVIGVGAAVDSEGTAYWAQTFGTHEGSEDEPEISPLPEQDDQDHSSDLTEVAPERRIEEREPEALPRLSRLWTARRWMACSTSVCRH